MANLLIKPGDSVPERRGAALNGLTMRRVDLISILLLLLKGTVKQHTLFLLYHYRVDVLLMSAWVSSRFSGFLPET